MSQNGKVGRRLSVRGTLELYLRQKGLCHYCQVPLSEHNVTVEHVVPRGWGGDPAGSNRVLVCANCNSYKATLENRLNPIGTGMPLLTRISKLEEFSIREGIRMMPLAREKETQERFKILFPRLVEALRKQRAVHERREHNRAAKRAAEAVAGSDPELE